MKLNRESKGRNHVRAADVINSPQSPEHSFDPRHEVHPTILEDLWHEIGKLEAGLDSPNPRVNEEFFLLEAWQYIDPEGTASILKKVESNWDKQLYWLVAENAAKHQNAPAEVIEQLFISLCRLFPHKTPELRRKFRPQNEYLTSSAYNPHNWTGPISLRDAMALVLWHPQERENFKLNLVAHLEDVKRRLGMLRKSSSDRWTDFADLLSNVLLLAPELKDRLGVQPEDVKEMKARLQRPSSMHIQAFDAARLVKAIVYYEAPTLSMSPEGRVALAQTPGTLMPVPPLPPREMV